ncbi:hypothetical protein CHS0354_037183 [Potamilus streckersoni]|uniref:Aminopeptidase n=1 Tax=Potamilus streckersoni TaxID=2493646 RepID=A0AAE0SXY7_9BIVA|nr:hypothetical protein CHS0354_037183 [Potamilus streckersoni]
MGADAYEMKSFSSEVSFTPGNEGKRGCYVSTAMGFALALIAVLIAVGVGIIVHFAGDKGTFQCHCTFPGSNGDSSAIVGDKSTTKEPNLPTVTPSIDQCIKWITEGNQAICNACPVPTTAATSSTRTPASTLTPAATTMPSTPTPTEKPRVTDVRLPTAVKPILYTVELQPDMYGNTTSNFKFNGSLTLDVLCINETRNITLHMKQLNITGKISVMEVIDKVELFNGTETIDAAREFLILHLKSNLQSGHTYTVIIDQFEGPLKDDLHGLYLSRYQNGIGQTVYIATTQFQPTDARKAFPCFDEPAIKAEFDITLVRQGHMKALSNMPIIRNTTRDGGWVADHFQRTPAMSTYLLAFIICDFDVLTKTASGNVTYGAWARPAAIQQANYSLDVGVKILEYFEDYFDVEYPLPKQDMIAIPDFSAGAMENWGLITYRETAMLYEEGVSSAGNKQRVAVVVSHELAHQWFGNLVTPSWWDDLWLNEGFASFVEYMGVDHVHPDWKMFEQIVIDDVQDVFNFDGLVSSHPVYVPVSHPDEINEIFDRISYGKGASIIRMMRFFLGEETFRKGLTSYLNKRRYGAAFHDDLWNALTQQSQVENKPVNVKDIMDTWVLQMNYPTVHVKVESTNTLTLTQTRYLRDPNATDPLKYNSSFGYKWEIPFTFTTSIQKNFNQTDADVKWFHQNISTMTLTNVNVPIPDNNTASPQWIIGNVMQYGYYRVNYELNNWNALIKQLNTSHTDIHTINRAQIINDGWNLAKSGEVDMLIALRMLEYLNKEDEYIPWSAAVSELNFVNTMLKRHALYGKFSTFMLKKLQEPFSRTGLNNTGATHLASYYRSLIVGQACSYGNKECRDAAKQYFGEWMRTDVNTIDPGLKSTVYCTAIEDGGQDEWEFAYNKYKTANLAAEQSRLLSAMSCSKHTWILSRYLEMALMDGGDIRRQDAVSVIVWISRNSVGRALAWDFFRERFQSLLDKFNMAFAMPTIIEGITASFNRDFELQQIWWWFIFIFQPNKWHHRII